MKSLPPLFGALLVLTVQACATPSSLPTASADWQVRAAIVSDPSVLSISQVTEVPIEKDAPAIEGHPLTSVVVTQCNLIVAVYMTMPDGRLLRFDRSTSLPSDQLMTMAYAATRSERVEVSCNDEGAEGYEKHDPI